MIEQVASRPVSRREFIGALSGVIGALAFAPTKSFAWANPLEATDLNIPEAIGNHYLSLFGNEPELKTLRARVGKSVDSVFSKKKLLEELAQEISNDYLAAQDFEYDRWLLSRTEGRLCALAALEAR